MVRQRHVEQVKRQQSCLFRKGPPSVIGGEPHLQQFADVQSRKNLIDVCAIKTLKQSIPCRPYETACINVNRGSHGTVEGIEPPPTGVLMIDIAGKSIHDIVVQKNTLTKSITNPERLAILKNRLVRHLRKYVLLNDLHRSFGSSRNCVLEGSEPFRIGIAQTSRPHSKSFSAKLTKQLASEKFARQLTTDGTHDRHPSHVSLDSNSHLVNHRAGIASSHPKYGTSSNGCRADYNVYFAVNHTDSNCFVNFAENSVGSLLVSPERDYDIRVSGQVHSSVMNRKKKDSAINIKKRRIKNI